MGKEFSLHRICLSAIFFFGNIALFVPYNKAKNGELSALLAAMAISVLLYFVWYFFADKLFSADAKTVTAKILILLSIAGCIYANSVTTGNFIDYVSNEMLVKSPQIAVLVLFSAICLYLVSKRNEVIAKFSLISFVFIVVVMLALFAVSFKNFEGVSAKELVCGDFVKRGAFYLFKAFLFPFVFAVFSRFAFFGRSLKRDVAGLVIGAVMLLVCFFSAVLTFGLSFASDIDFAYPMSISVVNIGELYTRMDGFAYFIFFLSALIKSAVCGLTIKMLLQKLSGKNCFKITALLMAVSFGISYLI